MLAKLARPETLTDLHVPVVSRASEPSLDREPGRDVCCINSRSGGKKPGAEQVCRNLGASLAAIGLHFFGRVPPPERIWGVESGVLQPGVQVDCIGIDPPLEEVA